MLKYVIVLAALTHAVLSYSGGAPKTVCGDLAPKHGPLTTQNTPPPYSLAIDSKAAAGKPLQVVLKGASAKDNIKGFIIQARLNNKPVGKFTPGPSSQTLECTAKDDTLTHKKIEEQISQIQTTWTPDSSLKGKTVQFVATVVQRGDIFWVKKLTKNVKIE